jgi:hypothetical protein
MKKAVFWDVAPCRYGLNRRFGGTYRLHLQGRREIIRKSLLPWRWRRYVPPKRRLRPYLLGATSQKTAFFIVTAVKTSNLTSVSKLVGDMFSNKCFSQVRMSHVLRFISICDLFTDSPLHLPKSRAGREDECDCWKGRDVKENDLSLFERTVPWIVWRFESGTSILPSTDSDRSVATFEFFMGGRNEKKAGYFW